MKRICLLVISILITFSIGFTAPSLPSPKLPQKLPVMSDVCKSQVKQFNNYLSEYNRQITAKNPLMQAQALVTLGVISSCVKRFDQAKLEFETALGLTKSTSALKSAQVHISARFNYGLLLRDTQQPELGLEQLEKGLLVTQNRTDLRTDAALLNLNIGVIQLQSAKCAAASTSFAKALQLYKDLGATDSVKATEEWQARPCP